MTHRLTRYAQIVGAGVSIVAYLAYRMRLIDGGVFLAIIVPTALVIMALVWHASKHFREYECASVPLKAFPPALREYAEDHTATLGELRFQHIDDFRLLSDPNALFSRAFISQGGRCFAAIAGNQTSQAICFSSVFDDGTYLESTNLDQPKREADPSAPLVFQFVSTESVVDLFESHRERVHELETERSTQALVSTADDYQDVTRYAQRLVGWDLHQRGIIWTPPVGRPVGVSDDSQQEQPDEVRV